MPIINSDLLILSVSSAISLFLVIKGVPTPTLLQINATLILVLLLSYRQFGSSSNQFLQKLIKGLLLLVSSALVQILVLATGGFFSPFLILLHIYTLGSSFLLNLTSSVTFLVFSVVILITHIIVDPRIKAIFLDDPWSVVLLSVSFLVIIPLAQYLIKTYRIKDTLSKLLHQKVQTSESILGGVSELIAITYTESKIISLNDVGERLLKIDSSVAFNRPLLEIIPLKNSSGELLTPPALPVAKVLENKVNYIINDVYLENVFGHFDKVSLQIRPILNEEGQVVTLAFVNSEMLNKGYLHHDNLTQAMINNKLLKESFRSRLTGADVSFRVAFARINHLEDDINITKELEDHPFKTDIKNVDLPYLCQQAVKLEQDFTRAIGVDLTIILPVEPAETSFLDLKQSKLPREFLPISSYGVPTDENYLLVATQKLIELASLLSLKTRQPSVEISVEKQSVGKLLIVTRVLGVVGNYSIQQTDNLLKEYYGSASLNSLAVCSGLEGYIAAYIARRLNIPLSISFNQYSHQIIISLELVKTPY